MRVLSENVKDQSGAVEQLDILIQRFLQLALMARGQFVVEQDHVGRSFVHLGDHFSDLSGADEGGRVGMFKALNFIPYDRHAGCVGQAGQLSQRFFDRPIVIGH
jgi:hypothetical protein